CDRNDLLAQLYRCEDWLIQNCISMPLWREHNSYQISDNVKGTYPDNAGGIPLTRVWISNS
ncbi:TPA: SgrR family transcriptional regulator, partial [Vibrio diabolicus]